MTVHYLPADEIKPGDVLPDISREPVARVTTFPGEYVRVTFEGTTFTRHFPHGGPGYGFPAARIERGAL